MNFRMQDLCKNNKSRRILKKFKKDRATYKDKKEKGYRCPAKY